MEAPSFRQSSPLSGRVGVQHAASLHPAPDVHTSQRLFFQTAAASLDALLDPEHEKNLREVFILLSCALVLQWIRNSDNVRALLLLVAPLFCAGIGN